MATVWPPHYLFAPPSTRLGHLAVRPAGGFVVFVHIFVALGTAGQRGGDMLFGNPWLTIPGVLAGGCGEATGITAVAAIAVRGERSFSDVAVALLGLAAILFGVGGTAVYSLRRRLPSERSSSRQPRTGRTMRRECPRYHVV